MLAAGATVSARAAQFARVEVRALARVLRQNGFAPLGGPVAFEHVFVADQFCSQTRLLGDVGLLFTRMIRGGPAPHSEWVARLAFGVVPYWVRFWQCLRRYRDEARKPEHLVNAGKYTSSIVAMSAAAFAVGEYRPVAVGLALVSTFYAFYWDLVMDWGLFDRDGDGAHARPCALRKRRNARKPLYHAARSPRAPSSSGDRSSGDRFFLRRRRSPRTSCSGCSGAQTRASRTT